VPGCCGPRPCRSRPARAFSDTGLDTSYRLRACGGTGARAQRLTGSSDLFSIRPEKIHIIARGAGVPEGMHAVKGQIRDVIYLGLYTRYLVEIEGGLDLVVVEQNLKTTSADLLTARGKPVCLYWNREHVRRVMEA